MKRAVIASLVLLAVLGGIAWWQRPLPAAENPTTRLAFVRGAGENDGRHLIVDYVELMTGEEAEEWMRMQNPECATTDAGCAPPHGFVIANTDETNEELPLADDAELIVSINNMPVYQTVDFPVFAAKVSESAQRRAALYDRIPFAIDIDAGGRAVMVREQTIPQP